VTDSVQALKLAAKDGALRFEVRAKPRAKKSRIVGLYGEALEVSLAAPPVDGAANRALLELLAEVLGVAKSQLAIVRGGGGRAKLIEVRGLTEAELRARIAGA
jgi:uncharacterized protein (TIGR00251 family)